MRKRRNQKILLIAIPAVLIVGLISIILGGNLSNLSGNSITEYYCSDETYTLEGNNCVKTIVKKAALFADVNLDDKIDSEDLNILNNYVKDENSVELSDIQIKVADINSDGMISELDVQILENYFTKLNVMVEILMLEKDFVKEHYLIIRFLVVNRDIN